ncbi:MAG: glycyl-radical enzyme activating protein [Syntrophales bacterium]|nr:glycyl-radical enzyme activating protein [Syntrophales bacterium]
MEDNLIEDGSRGIVFNVQRFSIGDGPGIRSTVFLKGCPLKCPWCANPESIRLEREIILGGEKCIKDGKCVEVCQERAISLADDRWGMDWRKCDYCLKCAEVCLSRRIKIVGMEMTVEEVMKEVMKDESLYRRTKGGITLSGGEPLLQWQFALALLQEAKRKGLHTAVDTSGYAHGDIMEKIAEYTDLLLYDIKHMDSRKHQQATGVPNQQILDNLQKIAVETKTKVWIWRPLIPDFNDSEEEMERLCKFVLDLGPAVEKISLLPLHKFGELKYHATGKVSPYQGMPLYSDERVEEFRRLIESRGLKADVGK